MRYAAGVCRGVSGNKDVIDGAVCNIACGGVPYATRCVCLNRHRRQPVDWHAGPVCATSAGCMTWEHVST